MLCVLCLIVLWGFSLVTSYSGVIVHIIRNIWYIPYIANPKSYIQPGLRISAFAPARLCKTLCNTAGLRPHVQEAVIKEQLRATLGLGAAPSNGAGTSQGAVGGSSTGNAGISFGGSALENGANPAEGAPKTDAASQEGVQDLGVISSKRV